MLPKARMPSRNARFYARAGDAHLWLSLMGVLLVTSRKLVRCTEKLLKIKSKLILIPFTFLLNMFFFFFFSFFVVQNVVGNIDKETLRIRFKIDPTFWFKKKN